MIREFRDFAVKGNVIDLAVAVIVGGAFGKIVDSLVKDVIMPPVGLALGKVDFVNLFWVLKEGDKAAGPYKTIDEAAKAGAVTMNYGTFVNQIVTFVVVAFSVFLMVRTLSRWKKDEPAAPSEPPRSEVLLEEIRDALVAKR